MRLRPISLFLAVLLLILLAWAAYWSAAANRLKDWVETWAERQRAAGGTVEYSDLTLSGFPLRLRMEAGAVRVRRADGTTLSAARLAAQAEPWNPLSVEVFADGDPRAVLAAAGDRPAASLGAVSATGHILLRSDGAVDRADLRLSKPMAGAQGLSPLLTAETLELWLEAPPIPPTSHTDLGIRMGLILGALALPGEPLMGTTVQRADLLVVVKGRPPTSIAKADVKAWSDDGGTVDLTIAAIDWGDLRIAGDATVAFDGSLQPVGAGTVTLIGFEALFDRLAATGRLDRQRAVLAKTALGLLARPTPDGALALKSPVTLQDRRLTLGPVTIAEFPPIAWD